MNSCSLQGFLSTDWLDGALQGCHAAHPELAAFCRDALLSCEALLHPRALSLQSRPAKAPPAGADAALRALLPHAQTAPNSQAELPSGMWQG